MISGLKCLRLTRDILRATLIQHLHRTAGAFKKCAVIKVHQGDKYATHRDAKDRISKSGKGHSGPSLTCEDEVLGWEAKLHAFDPYEWHAVRFNALFF